MKKELKLPDQLPVLAEIKEELQKGITYHWEGLLQQAELIYQKINFSSFI